jgi:cell division control protein 6
MRLNMAQKKLKNFFKTFLTKDRIFQNKQVLQSNYLPENILHRDDQINLLASILAPALNFEKPSNVFIYGKTGTGKTVSANYTTDNLLDVAKDQSMPMKKIYINCKLKRVADTEYRLIATLIKEFSDISVPFTGLPTDEVYRIFYEILDKERMMLIIILDEIDQLVRKTGDEFLYNLTRINADLKNSVISLIGISNDLLFVDNLDARIKSSLGEEELVFPPYDATQIQDILRERSMKAFTQGSVKDGVIEKCAALAAREHGDARRAIDLLRIAGELAERDNKDGLSLEYIDKAQQKIESDRVFDVVSTQPKHFQAVLFSIICSTSNSPKRGFVSSGTVYDEYVEVCEKAGIRPLTQRRVSSIIAELDMLGLINANVISRGRGGRTKEIKQSIPPSLLGKVTEILKKSLGF